MECFGWVKAAAVTGAVTDDADSVQGSPALVGRGSAADAVLIAATAASPLEAAPIRHLFQLHSRSQKCKNLTVSGTDIKAGRSVQALIVTFHEHIHPAQTIHIG